MHMQTESNAYSRRLIAAEVAFVTAAFIRLVLMGGVVASTAITGLASSAFADSITLTATLSGTNVDPPNASPGTGSVEVIYDPVAHILGLNVEFSGLEGIVLGTHIHCCTATSFAGNIGVATAPFVGFPLGVTSGTYVQTFDVTQTAFWSPTFFTNFGGGTVAGAEAAFAAGLLDGRAYFDIHSFNFPGGEIRGFLASPVLLPAALPLLASGLGGLGLMGWWRRRRRSSAAA